MNLDPIHRSTTDPNIIKCTICLEEIVSDNTALPDEEKPRVLDCSHVFHNACIGTWLSQKHSCPLCRNRVTKVATPEARPPEMIREEILAVPDRIQPVAAGRGEYLRNNENIALEFARRMDRDEIRLHLEQVREFDRNNPDNALLAVRQNVFALQYVPDRLRNLEIVMAAVRQNQENRDDQPQQQPNNGWMTFIPNIIRTAFSILRRPFGI